MDWNGHMIDQKIAPSLAQRIKAIPLCRTPQEDCTVWPQSRDGNYSVKTGYLLLCELENREAASGSNNADSRNFWRGIWSLRIPNKIKHFGWQACIESLPTLANLYRRKVEENMELFMVVTWFIWSRRNKMHFNEQHMPPEKILDAATALLANFHENHDCKPGRNLVRTQR
nr:hypothetical protein CFP56_57421 [Quercus suber]